MEHLEINTPSQFMVRIIHETVDYARGQGHVVKMTEIVDWPTHRFVIDMSSDALDTFADKLETYNV